MADAKLIAHIVYSFDVGGLENGVVNLINRLSNTKYRHLVVSLTPRTGMASRLPKDVEVVTLNKREGQDWRLYLRLYRIFREHRPDIVHTRNIATIEAQIPAWLARVPVRVHGEHGWDMADLTGGNQNYRRLRRYLGGSCDKVIALSGQIQHYLINHVGMPRSRIARICNGVDCQKFRPVQGVLPDGAPQGFFEPGNLVFGTVGRLAEVKNQTDLVKAFVALVQQHPEWRGRLRLLVVGEGILRPKLAELLDEAGVSELAWLCGNREDIPQLMAAMDVFVLPSLAEGISNTILEAMACGLPVVATDVGGNAELVIADQTGVLVPPRKPDWLAKAMAGYLLKPQMRQHHAQKAREVAISDRSLEAMVERYMMVYEDALASNGLAERKPASLDLQKQR